MAAFYIKCLDDVDDDNDNDDAIARTEQTTLIAHIYIIYKTTNLSVENELQQCSIK